MEREEFGREGSAVENELQLPGNSAGAWANRVVTLVAQGWSGREIPWTVGLSVRHVWI